MAPPPADAAPAGDAAALPPPPADPLGDLPPAPKMEGQEDRDHDRDRDRRERRDRERDRDRRDRDRRRCAAVPGANRALSLLRCCAAGAPSASVHSAAQCTSPPSANVSLFTTYSHIAGHRPAATER